MPSDIARPPGAAARTLAQRSRHHCRWRRPHTRWSFSSKSDPRAASKISPRPARRSKSMPPAASSCPALSIATPTSLSLRPASTPTMRRRPTRALRTATGQRLELRARAFLDAMARHGTTTVEVKTGCGPTTPPKPNSCASSPPFATTRSMSSPATSSAFPPSPIADRCLHRRRRLDRRERPSQNPPPSWRRFRGPRLESRPSDATILRTLPLGSRPRPRLSLAGIHADGPASPSRHRPRPPLRRRRHGPSGTRHRTPRPPDRRRRHHRHPASRRLLSQRRPDAARARPDRFRRRHRPRHQFQSPSHPHAQHADRRRPRLLASSP